MQNLIKVLIPRQLYLLLILSTGLLNHVILIPNLLTAAGRDSWLSVIAAYPISLIFVWLIYYILKNSSDEGFFSMLRQRLGSTFSVLLSAPVFLFLIASSYITLRDLVIWLNTYFLAETSLLMINIILILVCFITTLYGVKYMAISSGVLLPLVMLYGVFISVTNTRLKDPSLLFPLLANGAEPLMNGIVYSLSGLLEVYIIILLQPYSQKAFKFKHLVILLTLLAGLILGPLSASIMEFGPVEATKFLYPAHEQWRVLTIGEYISHLDFLALYQWLSGALIRIGLFMYLAGSFFQAKKKHYRLNPKLVLSLYLILIGLMSIKIETYTFYRIIYKYYLPVSVVFFLLYILLSALIILVLKKRDENHGKNKNSKFQSST
ncbi:spore germination protein (amino acid permease) [Cytobacillus firmus]|uniref:Spore germination protein (Amino acid permease) n=2 Tax=Cytobacillus TaxID=2675230 RepID=A0A366JM77_CYTFI|nr:MULTISPECIES: endospore germination permease [Cytobacillus]RBP88790.1 spore germination protein (amino acid permease) [Cytobacillus firmus]TDX39575.1 spore germination protein (amino acid permease) [Cytobacillus oceanisediminis]